MAKGSKTLSSNKSMKRDAVSGQFTIGRKSFASISAVEGIEITGGMDDEFRRTDRMTAEKRRSTLASKDGKKK